LSSICPSSRIVIKDTILKLNLTSDSANEDKLLSSYEIRFRNSEFDRFHYKAV